MKANEFLIEHKKNRKAKKYNVKPTTVAEPSKPRNFVAKNAINTGAGAHKDKKKAAKQGDTKHKNKAMAEAISTGNPEADKKIAELEAHLEHLEMLMASVSKISKENYYVLEEVESEIRSIEEAAKALGPRGSDMIDAIEEASTAVRAANAAVWSMEKTLKDLIRNTNSDIEDIESSEEWERRYGNREQQPTTEGKKIPFAGAKVGQKEGPAGQWRNDGPKAKKPAKPGDLVG